MRYLIVIPARMTSSRLPGKPLANLGGKPMVVRVAEQARLSRASDIYVATDSQRVIQAVEAHDFKAILTHADHPTGTDRLAEVVTRLELPDDQIIVNLQGDEPLIDPALLDAVAQCLASHPGAAIATCAASLTDAQALFNPNVVKVVCDAIGRALYFSRAPIPWARDILNYMPGSLALGLPALHHIGLYAYRAGFLRKFPNLAQGKLEQFEALEQLRALEHGYTIAVHCIAGHPAAGVDTPADLARVQVLFPNRL